MVVVSRQNVLVLNAWPLKKKKHFWAPQLIHFQLAKLLKFCWYSSNLQHQWDLVIRGEYCYNLSHLWPSQILFWTSGLPIVYLSTYLCYIFVQFCLIPICIFHLTPQILSSHDLMFHANLSLLLLYPFCIHSHVLHSCLLHLTLTLIKISLHSIKDM